MRDRSMRQLKLFSQLNAMQVIFLQGIVKHRIRGSQSAEHGNKFSGKRVMWTLRNRPYAPVREMQLGFPA